METQPPQGKTPEQVQLENILGSLSCVKHAISIIRNTPITAANLDQNLGTIAWLESLEMNLKKDFRDLHDRMPNETPETT